MSRKMAILHHFSPAEKGSASKVQPGEGSSRGLDLWREFKKYVFPKQGPVCVCRNVATFQFVMSAFKQFECEVCSHLVQFMYIIIIIFYVYFFDPTPQPDGYEQWYCSLLSNVVNSYLCTRRQ